VEVVGLDHVYLSVRDFGLSEAFYDRVMEAFGFKKGDKPIAGEPHAHYFNRVLQISIRPARPGSTGHDPYAPGLHHLCVQVRSREEVDEAWRRLGELDVAAVEPRLYPEYNPDYYATFFEDPDGIRLEVVARTPSREAVVARWEELPGFLNPWQRLQQREGGS
jgi:glyoxylase I family protein